MLSEFLHKYQEHLRLRERRERLDEAAQSLRPGSAEMLRIESLLERLHLFQIATVEALMRRTGMSEAEFLAIVAEVDAEDGRRDGRLDVPPQDCPKCERRNHAQRVSCVYCGELLPLPRAK